MFDRGVGDNLFTAVSSGSPGYNSCTKPLKLSDRMPIVDNPANSSGAWACSVSFRLHRAVGHESYIYQHPGIQKIHEDP